MRNLTKEAIELAKKEVIAQDANLADAEYRKRLSVADKQHIFMVLNQLASLFEQDLINQITYGRN